MKKIEEFMKELSAPVIEELGLSLWDVEYVKEGGDFILRVYIDSESGVSIDQCETVSRKLSKLLDEADPIENSYIFEVSSAGAERRLKRPSDFLKFIGSLVEVRLYKAMYGSKEHVGRLESYNDGDIEITSSGKTILFLKNDIANVRLRIELI